MHGPGVGKSTIAASIFCKLKELGFNVELITEYAKECVYENKLKTMQDQVYLLAKQYHKLKNALDHNDILITDSPLLLSCIYFKYNNLHTIIDEKIFNSFVFELNKSLNCKQINFLLVKDTDLFNNNRKNTYTKRIAFNTK